MTLGEKLRQLRQGRNLTQPELAGTLGIEQSYLSKLENGRYLPSAELLDGILEVFALPVGDLVDDLEPGQRNKLRQIPLVARHFDEQKKLLIGDRRRWLLASTMLLAFGVAIAYAGHRHLFVANVNFSYFSECVIPEGESIERYDCNTGLGLRPPDVDQFTTTTYRGERFATQADGGTRWYLLASERQVDPWQNKVIATLGVFLAVLGLTGVALERKLSSYQ